MKHLRLDNMPSNFELILAGDFHIGNADVSEHKIQRLKAKIKSKKNCYVSFGGDQLEAIDVTDKRFNLDEHAGGGLSSRIDLQRDAFIEDFIEVSDRVLWILDGNHECKWWNIFHPTKDIAEAFKTTYANGVMLKAIFPGFRLLDWHGAGYISSRAGSQLQRETNNKISLMRKLRDLGPVGDCEIAVSHHFHKIMVMHPEEALLLLSGNGIGELRQHYTQPKKIWVDEKKELYRVAEDDRWYVCSGSFLRSYIEGRMSYAERFGFSATELGVLVVEVRNDKIKSIKPDYME